MSFLVIALLAPVRADAAQAPVPRVVFVRDTAVVTTGPATVAQVLGLAGMRPRVGNLLDIRGGVLREGAFLPALTRNGVPVDASAGVGEADRIDFADAADRVEDSVVESFRQPDAVPQRRFGATVVTVRRGLLSGAVAPLSSTQDTRPMVALTFDDGPDPRWTPAILDALVQARATATFFVVGRNAARHPDIVRRELAAGMAVGDHTWDHARLPGSPVAFVADQLARARALVTAFGGRVTVFRPPYGRTDGNALRVASAMGLRTVLWDVDSTDWRRPGAAVVAKRILDRVRPGSIVLLHDGGGDRSQTVAAVRFVLDSLRSRGYGFTTL